jgi:hypothetical protein
MLADRQPHAHALGLRRKERAENTIGYLRIDTRTRILNSYEHGVRSANSEEPV